MTLVPTKFPKQFENPDLKFAIIRRISDRDIREARATYDPENPCLYLRNPDPDKRVANLLSRRKVAHCWQKPSKWGKLNQHSYDDPAFRGHIRGGGGYAVICNFGNHVCLDLDDLERLLGLGARLDLLPQTPTVKTGRPDGKGRHFYFYCQDLKQKYIFNDPELVKPDKNDKMKPIQLGSLQAGWSYVVGPGSLHPNGQIYEIIVDAPIATISGNLFWQVVGSIPRKQEKSKDRTARVQRAAKKSEAMNVDLQDHKNISSCVPVESVIELWENETGQKLEIESRDGPTIIASHPFHGSDSGHNFHLNIEKNVWTCFREARPGGEPGGSGGSGLELYAIYRGFLKCEECLPGCLYGKRFWEVVESAIEDGFEIPTEVLERYSLGNEPHIVQAEIVTRRTQYDAPPEKPPEGKVSVVKGPPRDGKSHWAIQQLIKSGSGTYITNRYSIIDHVTKIFRELGGKKAIVVEGKNREGMCRKTSPDCEHCELKPNEHGMEEGQVGYFQLSEAARKLVHQHDVLTKSGIPQEYCPYFALRFSSEFAEYVFTVVNNINNINISNRKFIVIDEDPTFDYFFAPSVEIARIKKAPDELHIKNNLTKYVVDDVKRIQELINNKQRKISEDLVLLDTFARVLALNDVLRKVKEGSMDKDQIENEIKQVVLRGFTERGSEQILSILATLDKYYRTPPYRSEEAVDLRSLITALLMPYKERVFHRPKAGNGYLAYFIIGDARQPLMNRDWVDKSENIILIGATMAEFFASKIDPDPEVINITKFKYAKNYIVIPIERDDLKEKKNVHNAQQVKLRQIIKLIVGPADSTIDRPLIVFSGSKSRRLPLVKEFGEKAHLAQEGGEIAQAKNFKAGSINLVVQNSTISRGLDLDQ